jgi:hypothetical protein
MSRTILAEGHSSARLNHYWLLPSCLLPDCSFELWSSWRPIQLHDLRPLTSNGVIAEGLPLESAFGECVLDIRVYLHCLGLFVFDVENFNSDVKTKQPPPNEVKHSFQRLLNQVEVGC